MASRTASDPPSLASQFPPLHHHGAPGSLHWPFTRSFSVQEATFSELHLLSVLSAPNPTSSGSVVPAAPVHPVPPVQSQSSDLPLLRLGGGPPVHQAAAACSLGVTTRQPSSFASPPLSTPCQDLPVSSPKGLGFVRVLSIIPWGLPFFPVSLPVLPWQQSL